MTGAWIGMLAGLVILAWGADAFVKGAGRLALAMGVSPLVVGLTIVGFGTSAPEAVVSVLASVEGQMGIAVGNVVGSNLVNALLILGLSALAAPLTVPEPMVRFDLWVLLAATFLTLGITWDGTLSHVDGLLLLAGLGYYLWRHVAVGRLEAATAAPPEEVAGRQGVLVALLVAGLGALLLGSHLLVEGAVQIAQALGVSELVIGLTLVAVGTSLPELATSVVATLRGERDIAVGNVIGSNIFNLLGVLGAASFVGSGEAPVPPQALAFDLPVMVLATVLVVPILRTGRRVGRLEGGLLVGLYVAYTGWLVAGS